MASDAASESSEEREYEYASAEEESDAETTEPTPGANLKRVSSIQQMEYEVIAPSELRRLMNETLGDLCGVLEVSPEAAYHLMTKFSWEKERLFAEYYGAPGNLLRELGVADLSVVAPSATITCRICYDESEPADAVQLGCQHAFCVECYTTYLTGKVADGPGAVFTPCAEADCSALVPEALFHRLLPPESVRRYERFLLGSFVDICRNMRWCPAAHCDRAVRGAAGTRDVVCDCGEGLCLRCGEGAHAPASCENLGLWQQKCRNESETANWIMANTKKCPKCSTRIEKNKGCNHMTCTLCRHEFCWICMGSWVDHSVATGGNYKCNRFTDADDAQTESQRAKRELDRYLHYYQRYHGHHTGEIFAADLRKTLDQRMTKLQKSTASAVWIDVQFLKAAQDQLIECRRVLKHTYVYGYYMTEGTGAMGLFENHQETLERFTEHLSELTERKPLDIDRVEVVDCTSATKRYLRNLLRAIQSGLDHDVEEAGEVKAAA